MSDFKLASVNSFQNGSDFSAAYWAKTNYLAFGSGSVADATIAPDGTMTGDLLIENAAVSVSRPLFRVNGLFPLTAIGGVIEQEAYFKEYSGDRAMRMVFGNTTNFSATPIATFYPSSGTVSGVSDGAAASITSAANGWWRCILRSPPVKSIASWANNAIIGYLVESGFNIYTGNSMSGVYIWGADLRKIVPHNPNYDLKYDGKKLESVHRTRSGAQYRYKWGDYKRAKYKVEDISSAHMTTINSWWGSNAVVRLFDLEDTCVVSAGYLVNAAAPIDQHQAPYFDLFQGTIELESN